MKLAVLKSMLFMALAAITGVVTSSAHAEATLSKSSGIGDQGDRVSYPIMLTIVDSVGVMYGHYSYLWDRTYVGMRGEDKRDGVFKLHQLQKDGTEKDLIWTSKEEAKNYCDRLVRAANELFDDEEIGERTVFVKGWYDGLRDRDRAIAVGYRVPYEGSYKGDLTRATKYLVCPNKLKIAQDNSVEDENELAGVRASGLSDTDYTAPEMDINGRYHVACMNPAMPETDFVRAKIDSWFEERGGLYFRAQKRLDKLEDIDATLGSEYCAGNLKELRVSPRLPRG